MQIARKWHAIVSDFDSAQQVLHDAGWSISARPRQKGEWALFVGDQEIASFSNRAEMEAFITGMGLAIGVMPGALIQQVKKIFE